MEPNAAQNVRAPSRLLFSLLALSVGLFVATFTVPVHAQDAVAPDDCAMNAGVHDDGDEMNGSDEDSVAVGCGANVSQTEETTSVDPVKQPIFTLDAGNTGDVDRHLVMVDCSDSEAGICRGRTGEQLVEIGKDLYDALEKVGETPLTDAQMMMLTDALSDEDNIRPLSDIALGENTLAQSDADIARAGTMTMNEVGDATAVGGGAKVKADGGVAIGKGATVGSDKTTTVTLTMDDELGMLVVGFEMETSGGGGDNGIAIGNGASATGMNSIAIGSGAKATGDGQIMVGNVDLTAVASDVGKNKDRIATNMNRLDAHDDLFDEHDQRLKDHGRELDDHRQRIGENSTKIDNNAARIDENRGMINSNTSKIGNNATRINENRGMINENKQMLGQHTVMIGNAMSRLDGHDMALMNLDERVMAHGVTLAAHDSRLDAHDQVLAGHAEGINNNAMQIEMVDERVSQVAAASAALSAVPNAPDMDEQFFIGVGVGSHGGESSVAAGISGRLGANKNIVVNAGVASGGSGTSVRAGVGWSF